MRIVLLQDAAYYPSYGGGNKANRLLVTSLAARGHDCFAICGAVRERTATRGTDVAELESRGIAFERRPDGTLRYRNQGVDVQTVDLRAATAATAVREAIEAAHPDWVLVSDDKLHLLLEAALRAAPERTVLAVHTNLHLPFGPAAHRQDAEQAARIGRVRGVIAASGYTRDYLRTHSGVASTTLRFPVYGTGPFRRRERSAGGCVTLINPCLVKGLPIFLDLAGAFPDVAFAAVPTWGASDDVLAALEARPNVRVLAPAEDIGEVLEQTRVLLVPSLIPETFGYVAIDAMLRGIPVMAAHLGGLPEAKLGVEYLLPVREARLHEGAYEAPPQDVAPWRETLHALVSDQPLYERVSRRSFDAAAEFVASVDASAFERYFVSLGRAPRVKRA
jgi:glycosyltransferase involved in cell wall biosynthesis